MNNEGDGNNYWQASGENNPFAPVDPDPNSIKENPAAAIPESEKSAAPDQKPAKSAETEKQENPEIEIAATSEEIAETDAPVELPAIEPIRWSASDAIAHKHGFWWNFWLVAVMILVIGADVVWSILNNNWSLSNISIIVLAVVAFAAIFVVSKKPPREVNYILTESGITIDGQLHPFSEFRAFGVSQDGALWQLTLIPVKRFGVNITSFITADQGEQIVDVLGTRLPMEKVSTHPVDRLTRWLKL